MPAITDMIAAGWGDPDAPGFRAKHIKTLRARGIAVPLNADPNIQYLFRLLFVFLDGLGANLDAHADDWGYANRDIRGYPGRKSYHAWGLAFDGDALENPLGLRRTTFPVAKTRAVAKRLGMRWGYDYTDRPDPMHFEFTGTRADAARIAKGLRTRKALTALAAVVGVPAAFLVSNGLIAPTPAPAPKPPPTSSKPATPPTSPSTAAPSPTTQPTGSSPASSPAVSTVTTTRTVTATRTRTVTATRTVRPPAREYVIVAPGDTLTRIAAARTASGRPTTVATLRRLNPLLDPLRLQPGTLVRTA